MKLKLVMFAAAMIALPAVAQTSAAPNTSTQGAPPAQTAPAPTQPQTKVLVPDGGTVVIGGIIVSNQRTDITQVPLVGSLPLIGHLFRRSNVSTSSQELLFFLTPRIIPG